MGDSKDACNRSRTTLHQDEAATRNVRCYYTLLQLYDSVKEKTGQLLAHLCIYFILFHLISFFKLFFYFNSWTKISQKFVVPNFMTTLWTLCYMRALDKFSCINMHTIPFYKISSGDQKKWANVGPGSVLKYTLAPSDFGGILECDIRAKQNA